MSAGTISLTHNSAVVTGAGTAFTSDLKAGDIIASVVGGVTYTLPVKTVNSTASVTLIKNYDGPTQAGAAWYAIPRDAMNAITAQLAADTAQALRSLNYDKQNWQQVFSATGDVTVKLPDGSSFTGPSWGGITTQLSNKADAKDIEKLEKEKMSVGAFGLGSKADTLPDSLGGASGFFGAGNYTIDRGAAVVIQSSYGAERRGQFGIAGGNSYFRFCTTGSDDPDIHPWKRIAAHGDPNINLASGFTVSNTQGTQSYVTTIVVNRGRPSTDNGSSIGIEIPYTAIRPYFVQRRNDGTNTGQIINEFPTATGALAVQGTSGLQYKRDIVDSDATEALNRINQIRFVNFIYKDDEQNRERFGFIAEEVEQIAPQYIKHMQELVDETLDPDTKEIIDRVYRDRPCIDNNPIVMDLLGAIQVLNSKLNEQETRLLALEKTISST